MVKILFYLVNILIYSIEVHYKWLSKSINFLTWANKKDSTFHLYETKVSIPNYGFTDFNSFPYSITVSSRSNDRWFAEFVPNVNEMKNNVCPQLSQTIHFSWEQIGNILENVTRSPAFGLLLFIGTIAIFTLLKPGSSFTYDDDGTGYPGPYYVWKGCADFLYKYKVAPEISPPWPYCKGNDPYQPIVKEGPKLTDAEQQDLWKCLFEDNSKHLYDYIITCKIPDKIQGQGFGSYIRYNNINPNIEVTQGSTRDGIEFCIRNLGDAIIRVFCPDINWILVNDSRLVDSTSTYENIIHIAGNPDLIHGTGQFLDLCLKIGF